jgi:hypothetical protein
MYRPAGVGDRFSAFSFLSELQALSEKLQELPLTKQIGGLVRDILRFVDR